MVAASGVTLGGKRVPPDWAREVRRLFVPPAPGDPPPTTERPALRLLEPDPGNAAVFDPPAVLRWSAVPGVKRYQLSLEALTDPVEPRWQPVQDLFMLDVTGTRFEVPAGVNWASGAVYRWRVQTGDGSAVAGGRFRILSAAQRERLLAARRMAGNSHLVRAAIYHSFGLYDAALDELRALRRAQPQQPVLQRAVLNVQADIRRQRVAALVE
jgi:hypothetical protein